MCFNVKKCLSFNKISPPGKCIMRILLPNILLVPQGMVLPQFEEHGYTRKNTGLEMEIFGFWPIFVMLAF